MRYAVIADAHGNYPALQAVLQDAKKAGAEQFLFLGDYMTDFPFTREIVAVLRSLPHAVFVSGNREWYLDSLDPAQRGLEQYAALFLTQDALRPEELAWVKQLPRTAKLPTPDGARTLYLQHESPVALDHRGQKTPASGELDELFPQWDATGAQVAQYVRKSFLSNLQLPSFLRQTGASVFLHGHSHLQYAVEVEGVLLLNPGSCGLPLDHRRGAPYTLLDYEAGRFTAEERRVPYDVDSFLREVRQSPEYEKAAGWNQLNLWQLCAARDYNRVFFQMLQEEKQLGCSQTVQEQNQAFHRALSRAKEYYENRAALRSTKRSE